MNSRLGAAANSLSERDSRSKGSRRPDIQGLRAFAVLVVVAYHAGLPLPGGFVGVDVFFVLSGYVITAMLNREWVSTGSVRFGAFYLRRFKRLIPALAVVVVFTMILSSLLLSPSGAQQTAAKTGIAAMLSLANFAIIFTTGDYFDALAETNPLLHTWSLSIEEQFYLVFPAILVAGWLVGRRFRRPNVSAFLVVSSVAAVSFGVALLGSSGIMVPIVPESLLGFYSPVTRAWEFAAGALLALAVAGARHGGISRNVAQALALLGSGILLASLWLIDGATPFPSAWTLLPVTGTLLLLLSGTHESIGITRAISARPLVRIGDWSYSIYLWHWPLIVFATLVWPGVGWVALLAALISFVPAIASYNWVEQPLRNLRVSTRSGAAVLVAAVLIPPIIIASAVLFVAASFWLPKYESGEFPVVHPGDVGQLDFFEFVDENYYPCTPSEIRDAAPTWEGITRCHQSQPDGEIEIALLGDSHAEQLFLGLAAELPGQNIAYYTATGQPSRSNPDFAVMLDHVAATPSIDTVILSAFWKDWDGKDTGLIETLETLREAGKTVYATDDIPDFPFNPYECKYRKAPVLPWANCSRSTDDFKEEYDSFYPTLAAVVGQVDGVRLLNTAMNFCDDTSCSMTRDGELMYRDEDHLTMNGSRFLARWILKEIAKSGAPLATGARLPD